MNRFCCFSLKTGGYFIGVFELIVGIIEGIYFLLGVLAWIAFEEAYKGRQSDPNDGLLMNILSEAIRQDALLRIFLVKIILIAFLVICCMQIIMSSVLIHATRKKSHILMTVWMVFKVILIVILGTLLIADSFNGINVEQILLCIFVIGLNVFSVKVVHDLKMHNITEANVLPIHGK